MNSNSYECYLEGFEKEWKNIGKIGKKGADGPKGDQGSVGCNKNKIDEFEAGGEKKVTAKDHKNVIKKMNKYMIWYIWYKSDSKSNKSNIVFRLA